MKTMKVDMKTMKVDMNEDMQKIDAKVGQVGADMKTMKVEFNADLQKIDAKVGQMGTDMQKTNENLNQLNKNVGKLSDGQGAVVNILAWDALAPRGAARRPRAVSLASLRDLAAALAPAVGDLEQRRCCAELCAELCVPERSWPLCLAVAAHVVPAAELRSGAKTAWAAPPAVPSLRERLLHLQQQPQPDWPALRQLVSAALKVISVKAERGLAETLRDYAAHIAGGAAASAAAALLEQDGTAQRSLAFAMLTARCAAEQAGRGADGSREQGGGALDELEFDGLCATELQVAAGGGGSCLQELHLEMVEAKSSPTMGALPAHRATCPPQAVRT